MTNEKSKTDEIGVKCEKRYSYEYSMFWECNDGCKCQILEDDVVDLLNEQQLKIRLLEKENEDLQEVNKENQLLHEENDVLKQQLKTRYVVNKQYEELQRLREENQELKQLIKRMGELGGFNKHMIKTICGD